MKQSLDLLIKHRSKLCIPNDNPFVFATPSCKTALQPWPIIQKLSQEFGCANVATTKLRKYLATSVQVLDLKEQEQDWLARHLGHDIRVHRDFYRKHDGTIKKTKIAKLLHLSEEGMLQSQAGKSLSEVTFQEPGSSLLDPAQDTSHEQEHGCRKRKQFLWCN